MASENRLITAIDAERPAHPETQYDTGYNNGLTMAVAIAIRMDAVDVVRCKDCKHWHEETGWCYHHSHFIGADGEACHPWESIDWKMLNADDFCSYGERRTDNEVHSSDPCHL